MAKKTTSVEVPFYQCRLPSFDEALPACDRPVWEWLASVPPAKRTPQMDYHAGQIANRAENERAAAYARCEESRYGKPEEETDEPRLNVSVTTRLKGSAPREARSSNKTRPTAQLTVSFAPGSGCPPVPWELLNRVKAVGANFYPGNTRVEVVDYNKEPDGQGPWEGMFVLVGGSPQNPFWDMFEINSVKVFDHWVEFEPLSDPEPPADLLAHAAEFDFGRLRINLGAIPSGGATAPAWRLVHELTHVESGESYLIDRWLDTAVLNDFGGVTPPSSPVGLGGAATTPNTWSVPMPLYGLPADLDGTWIERLCVYDFRLPSIGFAVEYAGAPMESGNTSITPLASQPYVPGVSVGFALAERTLQITTGGKHRAAMQFLDIEPVPGVGVRLTVKVLNELPFSACIFASLGAFRVLGRNMWGIAKNLPAHSESEPISLLLPILMDANWLGQTDVAVEDNGWSRPQESDYLDDGPVQLESPLPFMSVGQGESFVFESFLLADGTRIKPGFFPGVKIAEVLLQEAPGAAVPDFSQQFELRYDISYEEDVGTPWSGPSWVSRGYSGLTLVFPLNDAIERYGNILTMSATNGHPVSGAYWVTTAFYVWSGGDADELADHMIDELVLPLYDSGKYRNVTADVVKKPGIVLGRGVLPSSTFGTPAQPIIEEIPSATTFRVVLDPSIPGWWEES